MSFFLENWYLILLAIGSGAMLFVPALSKGGLAGITPAQAVQKMNSDKAVVIDVRSAEEFAAGHIKGARNVPLDQLGQQLAAAVKSKSTPLLFACASGPRANRGLLAARKQGFEQGFVIAGGMKAWTEAGLPVTKGGKRA